MTRLWWWHHSGHNHICPWESLLCHVGGLEFLLLRLVGEESFLFLTLRENARNLPLVLFVIAATDDFISFAIVWLTLYGD